ncbi:MAG: DNA repair protein RecO C-terminal domain-containing protein [Moraxella sp.]|nr:DNA repair protein RecO C-terminal domain-containing protein [Moraxella sp.]
MTLTHLTGFIIHSRPYQEKRAIYQLFSREWGVVHGVGGRGVPSFVMIELFATGQNSLKTFSQIHIATSAPTAHVGQNQYALLYLNELIYKLVAVENPCPALWHSYHDSVERLHTPCDMNQMKAVLRHFETALFDELGVSIDWAVDSVGQMIDECKFYQFIPNQGFVKSITGISGETILKMTDDDFDKMTIMGQIHRTLIDDLLEYKPLNSRKLWAEQLKYR